jgi:ankyrin repeat protein
MQEKKKQRNRNTSLHNVLRLCNGKNTRKVFSIIEEHPEYVRVRDDSNKLPLHVACSKRSWVKVPQKLIIVYPDALKEKDDNKELPLHLACAQYCPGFLLEEMITMYPDALQYPDRRGE